jgi:DNA polymerase V
MVRHPESTFYARIAGDSMIEAGIREGDIVVIDRSLEASNGDFVVACVDGEFTIKEYQFDSKNQCVWLIPHNQNYTKIKVTEENNFSVWGVVTYCVHKTKGTW